MATKYDRIVTFYDSHVLAYHLNERRTKIWGASANEIYTIMDSMGFKFLSEEWDSNDRRFRQ